MHARFEKSRIHRLLSALTLCFGFSAYAQVGVERHNWSPPQGSAPPPGAYSPDRVTPDFGPDFNPDGTPRTAGESQRPYDSWADPNHPLKSPAPPPPEWVERDEWVDADHDGRPDLDADGKPVIRKAPVFPQDGSPPVQRAQGDIDWGERYYDGRFEQILTATNKCAAPRPITITVRDLPYLQLPTSITVEAGERREIRGQVTLPPEPPPPLRLGLPGEPGWGWVDFPIPIGQPLPMPKLHQPNFVQIEGSVELWHPWAPASAGEGGDCLPRLVTYRVTGHIHFRPPPPSGDSGPSRIATHDPCEVYWNIGVPPAQLGERDCTQPIRRLARRYIDRVLAPYIQNAPEEWYWLAGLDPAQMNIGQLLAMKRRADGVLGW